MYIYIYIYLYVLVQNIRKLNCKRKNGYLNFFFSFRNDKQAAPVLMAIYLKEHRKRYSYVAI